MTTDKEILEKTRLEYNINPREWEHECFEGFYVPEICLFAMNLARREGVLECARCIDSVEAHELLATEYTERVKKLEKEAFEKGKAAGKKEVILSEPYSDYKFRKALENISELEKELVEWKGLPTSIKHDLAYEIKRLTEENTRLREALEEIKSFEGYSGDAAKMFIIAKKALDNTGISKVGK
jgi:hypothetical protein